MNCEKILIAGFSGAGKSSFLRELEYQAPEEGWVFQDLDNMIFKSRGRGHNNLASLIEQEGWEKFRLWERQEIEGFLKEEGKGILALGGGSLTQLLLELYRPSRKIGICLLSAPFEDCWERLHLESSEPRPLVKLGKNELHRIFKERLKIFEQIPWRIENPKGAGLSEISQKFWEQVFSS